MSEPTKICNRCKDPKLLSEFGKNSYYATRGAKDGRQPICKSCINGATAKRRETYREREQLRPRALPKAKEKVNPVVEVMKAVNAGYRTREQIEFHTGLDEDLISDALATLAFEYETVRVDRTEPEARFYPRAKAA